MDGYVAKPVNPEALAKALVEWLLPEGTAAAEGDAAAEDPAPEPAGAGPPRWDRASVLARVGGDEAMLVLLLSEFTADMRLRANALRQAVEAGDRTSVHLHAVSVQVAAAHIGADELEQTARQLDEAVHMGRAGDAESCLTRLSRVLDQLARAFGLPQPRRRRSRRQAAKK